VELRDPDLHAGPPPADFGIEVSAMPARSSPAPLIRHELTMINSSSVTAVFKIARLRVECQ
jgi:hypothetical protein